MKHVYLGWDNPQRAYTLLACSLIILCNDKGFKIIEGGVAEEFKKQVRDLTLHVCGISKSTFAENLLKTVEPHPHDINAYNAIYNKFWEMGNKEVNNDE